MAQQLVHRAAGLVDSESGALWAVVDQRNPLAEPVEPERKKLDAPRVVMWSGWMGEGDMARGVFQRDFRTWSQSAWARLGEVCKGREGLVVRPHARHVLSDAQSCVTFFGKYGGVGLLLDPAGMLTPEMVPRAEEHLARIVGTLFDLLWAERVPAVVVRGASLVLAEWGEELAPGDDVVRRSLVEGVVDQFVPAEVPRVIE